MKLSLITGHHIFFNTSLLLSQLLSTFIESIEKWAFLILEFVLLAGWYIHKTIKDLKKECIIDFGKLNIFIYRNDKKK